MTIPIMKLISGQGGNISFQLNGNGSVVVLQVAEWQISKQFLNADVTTTGSGGWAENMRILAAWSFQANWFFDSAAQGSYEGVQLVNGIYVPVGLETPTPAAIVFQCGNANPGMIYQGNVLAEMTSTQNNAKAPVHFQFSGVGTRQLIGPTGGSVS